eukprot:11323737-Heterocapsa_arctica.AAC.1
MAREVNVGFELWRRSYWASTSRREASSMRRRIWATSAGPSGGPASHTSHVAPARLPKRSSTLRFFP